MLDAAVLVLNRSYLPIHVTSVRRAYCLLYRGLARAVDERYETFDFDAWRRLVVRPGDLSTGIVGGLIRAPRVVLLGALDWVPRRHVRFSRVNIYARDLNTCQYCKRHMTRSKLNLDHVVPRSQGGKSTWENVVCCCRDCNRRKGGRTPGQAGMSLLRRPRKPRWSPVLSILGGRERHPDWRPFLSVVDATDGNAGVAQT